MVSGGNCREKSHFQRDRSDGANSEASLSNLPIVRPRRNRIPPKHCRSGFTRPPSPRCYPRRPEKTPLHKIIGNTLRVVSRSGLPRQGANIVVEPLLFTDALLAWRSSQHLGSDRRRRQGPWMSPLEWPAYGIPRLIHVSERGSGLTSLVHRARRVQRHRIAVRAPREAYRSRPQCRRPTIR